MQNEQGEQVRRLISADMALEWAQGTAEQWAPTNPASGLGGTSPVETIRAAVGETVTLTAGVMAREGAGFGANVSTDEHDLREWLRFWCDGISEPVRATPRNRAMAPLGSTYASNDARRPLRRWLAASRSHMQATGIIWLRGQGGGACRFSVTRIQGQWTVIEHGWPESETELLDKMVGAITTASEQEALAQGRLPARAERAAAAYRADAARCSRQPELQPPDWILTGRA